MVWDKANLEGKVTVDDPMEAVKAIVPKMKAAGADFILVAAHSGIGDNEYTKNEENEGYQIAGIEGVDAVATGHSHADFPNGDGTSFYAKYPGVDDVNGLINGNLWLWLVNRGSSRYHGCQIDLHEWQMESC